MKTFFISAGMQLVPLYNLDERGTAYQSEHVCGSIDAETRGKARAEFCRDNGFEFMERMFIRVIKGSPNTDPESDEFGVWPEYHQAYLAACAFFGIDAPPNPVPGEMAEFTPPPLTDGEDDEQTMDIDSYNARCAGYPEQFIDLSRRQS